MAGAERLVRAKLVRCLPGAVEPETAFTWSNESSRFTARRLIASPCAHHSLKSPACSCVSITLPASLPAHVQQNIAFAGLMNSVHSVRYGCDFADVLCRFSSRVSCRVPDDLGQIFNLFSKLGSSISVEEL